MPAHDIDPSLRTGESARESLDDGFSPPARQPLPPPGDPEGDPAAPAQPALGPKSPF
jgi:hypothetical protein